MKTVSCPLVCHFGITKEESPKRKHEMMKIPYASVGRSLMYAMVCTRQDIAFDVSVVRRFLSNPGKEHWEGIKWI